MLRLRSTSAAKWYLSLLPVYPPEYYESRQPLERARQEHADESSSNGFHNAFAIDFRNRDVLDLGCGYGGRTVWYKEAGARSATGIEIADEPVQEAMAFARERAVDLVAMKAVGESLPFPAESFDVITSYDVFEHVESLASTLNECYRVLRTGGTLYALFPPFYHPTGGSHLHGYVSRSPAPNVLFTPDSLRAAIDQLLEERGSTYRPNRRATEPLPSVNGTTIRSFKKLLQEVPFTEKVIHLDPLKSTKLRAFNSLPRLGLRLPWVQEICTSRIRCELTK